MRHGSIAILVLAGSAVAGIAWAQLFRTLEIIPEPTVEDAPPGVDRGSTDESLPTEYRRQPVYYRTTEPPGTLIVNTSDRYLYLIQPNSTALGAAEGDDRAPALSAALHGRRPRQSSRRPRHVSRRHGRIHGTNAPETIGHAVSSGCFRLVNDDVADLYNRVTVGTKVVVRH